PTFGPERGWHSAAGTLCATNGNPVTVTPRISVENRSSAHATPQRRVPFGPSFGRATPYRSRLLQTRAFVLGRMLGRETSPAHRRPFTAPRQAPETQALETGRRRHQSLPGRQAATVSILPTRARPCPFVSTPNQVRCGFRSGHADRSRATWPPKCLH